MNCSIASVFPELYTPFLSTGILQKAIQKSSLQFDIHSFFEYVNKKERIDAPTFGPGPGMLIKPEVVEHFIENQEKKFGRGIRIFFSPHGTTVNQHVLQKIVEKATPLNHMIFVAARYEGIDARVEEKYADFILSVGQFVAMGGDLPAMLCIESLTRLLPGVLGNEDSVKNDSFQGALVDYPEFTHPIIWHNKEVPEIIRSGDHEKIRQWRLKEATKRTVQHHFNWMREQPLSQEIKNNVHNHIPKHYIGLLHNDIVVDHNGRVGHTSITSTDIHDIARSARTYNIEHYFLISELIDQQKIAQVLLGFWQEGSGIEYNNNRHQALQHVSVINTLDAALQEIEKNTGQKPLLVVTSARNLNNNEIPVLSYSDHEILWESGRPLLLLFGTGKGISEKIIKKADFMLEPVVGLSEFNHLSVRSAVAIILDRLLGLHKQNK